jgi:hypothetical protein
MTKVGALATICWLAGCAQATDTARIVTSEVDQPVTLHVGESALIGSPGVTVRFVSVVADSRCPTRVECVWAGDGAVALEFTPAGGFTHADTVHTTIDPKSVAAGGWTVELTQLAPYPEVPGGIAPEEYLATFVGRRTP